MRVGLNLIFLVPGETGGMEVYARELIAALLEQAPPEVELTAFVNRETARAGGVSALLGTGTGARADDASPDGALSTVTVPVNARSRAQWVLGEQGPLPPLAARAQVDVLHSLASTAPLWVPPWGRFKRVTTVHDLIYARYPEAHGGLRDKGMRVLVPAAVRRSDRVIAISQSTRDDLIELLGTPTERIDVVPNGLGAVRRETPLPEPEIRARHGLAGRRVALSLSAKRPHKNLLALIEALAAIPAERRPVLVLPGYPTWHEAQLRARATELGVDADVRFPGWVSGAELEGLWAVSDAFVFPSLYEGFGLPILEAMARGVPVACSNASSLPEVAGEAAVMFDPRDRLAMAAAIETLLSLDDVARARACARGRAQAETFTWRRAAEATLASYARAFDPQPA
jgi:glycosyltransferase involved in cell wall biosynthesis